MENVKDEFSKRWTGILIEDDVFKNSKDVKIFAKDFRRYLRKILPDCRIVDYKLGDYEVSASIEDKNGNSACVEYDVPRGAMINTGIPEQTVDPLDYYGNIVSVRGARNAENLSEVAITLCTLCTIDTAVRAMFAK